jgi:Flp pilus assembly protein TadG
MPILLLLISLTADAALLFGAKANVLRVVQDANRAASIGRLGTDLGDMTTGARNYVRTNIGYMATNATITSQIVNGNVISTTVVIPSNDLIANGFLGRLTNINITINAQHLLEI